MIQCLTPSITQRIHETSDFYYHVSNINRSKISMTDMAFRSIFHIEADIRARDDGYDMEIDIAYNFKPCAPAFQPFLH